MANLVANVLIVLTGGAVRLTASGLGCPTWPRCTSESFVTTPEMGAHGLIEFGNRQLTFALAAVALATFLAAWRSRPRRPDVVRLSFLLLLGIPLQVAVGGITVLTKLNPWTVMLHFLVSMAMIAVGTVLVHRARGSNAPTGRAVPAAARRLVVATLATLGAVLYAGAVVTGSGPHAGDSDARRTGLDPGAVSQLHADLVFLLIGLTVGVIATLAATAAPRRAVRAGWLLLGAELAQGVVGYAQYALALPALLVGLHLLGAALVVVAAVHLFMTTQAGEEGTAAEPALATAELPARHPAPLVVAAADPGAHVTRELIVYTDPGEGGGGPPAPFALHHDVAERAVGRHQH